MHSWLQSPQAERNAHDWPKPDGRTWKDRKVRRHARQPLGGWFRVDEKLLKVNELFDRRVFRYLLTHPSRNENELSTDINFGARIYYYSYTPIPRAQKTPAGGCVCVCVNPRIQGH